MDKICLHCSIKFFTLKINKAYCSFTCKNRASSKKNALKRKKEREINHIKRKPKGLITKTRVCILCNEEYTPSGSNQRLCTKQDEIHRDLKYKWKNDNRYKSYNNRGKFTNKYRTNRRQHWLNKYKCTKGCDFCSYRKHFSALDFDHTDPNTKHENVSRMIGGSLKNLFREIRKCQLLCACCHREKTYIKIETKKRKFL